MENGFRKNGGIAGKGNKEEDGKEEQIPEEWRDCMKGE